MLTGIFHKRKKGQEVRTPSLQDVKKFRDAYAKYAELRQVETPPCFEKSIYKAIAGQKELHAIDFRQEDITDPQMIALAEALVEMPIVSSLDLRDNRITDDGAKALLEVLRLQIITAKTPPTIDSRTKQPLYPSLPEYARYVTNVNLKGNEVSAFVLQELAQYLDVLRREDKRLEIRVALARIHRNSDGRIDEEEFKRVLKLLTASTPTNREIRTFLQQHTLSTDNAQNATNLENVLLAKCATSPSRHAACPPWESLVQERHALLGVQRMAPTMMTASSESLDPQLSNNIRLSRLSYSSSGVATMNATSIASSNNAPDLSPVSHVAPVAPIETATKPALVANAPVVPQLETKVSEPKSAALPSDRSVSFTKHPSIPQLSLASVLQYPVNPSPRSARSSADDEGQRYPSVTREGGSSFVKHATSLSPCPARSSIEDEGLRNVSVVRDGGPNGFMSVSSSPHDSDTSDSVSAVSSALGGSNSQRTIDDHDRVKTSERKAHAMVAPNVSSTYLDSPRWQSESVLGDEEEEVYLSVNRGDVDTLSASGIEDDVHSISSHRASRSLDTSQRSNSDLSDNKSYSGADTLREVLAVGYDKPSTGQDDKHVAPLTDDLASEGSRSAPLVGSVDKTDGQPEDEGEGVEECIESVVFDVTKDSKERSVIKLVHHELRKGLRLQDFPLELQFRNMLALLLPGNGLSDLALFSECRFPFVIVLDLSKNNLMKLGEEGLTAFPRLEVLDLAENRLKSITGLSKLSKLRALSLSHNAIRTVINIEHLAQLEVLQLANNQIVNVPALRLLSLNKVLAHLNLDGNPVVETDERQKRKNIVNVRNLLPALQSLGSIPCANVFSKDKKRTNNATNLGRSLFDSDLIPHFNCMWVSTACDTLCIFQDAASSNSSKSQHEEWGTRNEDDEQPSKLLTREQQRQKDQLRSRATGSRKREKVVPSPENVKTSMFCFGPSRPFPAKKKKKKKAFTRADPSVVREQQRRANELSAPKYVPVDQTLMRQEQKRKARIDFYGAMTVGERLQLARDMNQRRSAAPAGLSTHSRPTIWKPDSRKRVNAATTAPMGKVEEDFELNDNSKSESRVTNPQQYSLNANVFHSEEDHTLRSTNGALTLCIEPNLAGIAGQLSSPKLNEPKEAGFLHELAVSDFLTHAQEEFSTAVTALNVLLLMSEKEQGGDKKLADYRASLDALDILNENESHTMFKRTQGRPDHERRAQCIEWFVKLGVVKKCMRQLLEKLEGHAPGSGVIRAYCRFLRSNELRGIVTSMLEVQEGTAGETSNGNDAKVDISMANISPTGLSSLIETVRTDSSASSSVAFCFVKEPSALSDNGDNGSSRILDANPKDICSVDHDDGGEGNDFGILETTESIPCDDEAEEMIEDAHTSQSLDDISSVLEIVDHTSISQSMLLTSAIDTTLEVLTDKASSLTGNEEGTDGNPWKADASQRNEEALDTSAVLKGEDEGATFEETEDPSAGSKSGCHDDQVTFESSYDKDLDWLTTSIELDAEINDTKECNEQSQGVQDCDWSITVITQTKSGEEEAPFAIDEANEPKEVENIENDEENDAEDGEVDGEVDGDVDGDATGDAEPDFEDREFYEMGGGVDADDEEAEIFGDWEKGFDPNSNHYFWFNHTTSESSWTPPEGWPYEIDEPFSTEDTIDVGEEDECEEDPTVGDKDAAEGRCHEEEEQCDAADAANEQMCVAAADDKQWHDEIAVEDEEHATREQSYDMTGDEQQQLEQGGKESPRRSEVSDFEFDDMDLPI